MRLVFILVLLPLLLAGCSKRPTVQLPDGREQRWVATSFGTNHSTRSPTFSAIQDFAADHIRPAHWHLLPERWRPGASLQTVPSRLVVFLSSRQSPNPRRHPLVVATFPNSNHRVGELQELATLSGLFAGLHYSALVVDLFPRRARELTLELHDGYELDGERHLLRGIPNPMRVTRPSWIPDTLPSRQTHDGVTVTLSDLYACDVPAMDSIRRRPYRIPDRRTQVVAVAEDARHRAIPVVSQRLSDPGGNVLFQPVGQPASESPSFFNGSLFDDEPSWQLDLETELPESLDPAHPLDERFVLRDLMDNSTTNPEGAPQSIPISRRFPELRVVRLSVDTGIQPKISVLLDHRPRDARVMVAEVRDETGRAWDPQLLYFYGGESGTGLDGFCCFFEPRDMARMEAVPPKSLTVTLRVFRTTWFTFHPASKFRPPARSLGLSDSGTQPSP